MLTRVSRLLSLGGWNVFLRTALMLMTAIGLSIFEYSQYGGVYCAIVTAVFLLLGWTFRKSIMELGANYRQQSSRILPIYAVCFVVARYAGLGNQLLLAIIAIGCMLMFSLNFWSITEAAIVDDETIVSNGG